MSGDRSLNKRAFDLSAVKADLGELFGAPHMRVLHQHPMVLTNLGREMALNLPGPCVAQTRRASLDDIPVHLRWYPRRWRAFPLGIGKDVQPSEIAFLDQSH